jgi:Flp pilus assembly pilin Flp
MVSSRDARRGAISLAVRDGDRSVSMNGLGQRFLDFLRSDGGPTATEYAVLIAVICVAVIGALSSFGVHMDNLYTSIAGTVPVTGS